MLIEFDVAPPTHSRCKRRFIFEDYWVSRAGCKDTVAFHWGTSDQSSSNPINSFVSSIWHCSQGLQAWHKSCNKSITNELQSNQRELDSRQSDGINLIEFEEVKCLEKEVSKLMEQEELYWWQHSRVAWMLEWDRNTQFFHQKASQRKKNNFISGVLDSNDSWCTNENEIQDIAVGYFNSLFSSLCHTNDDIDAVVNCVQSKVSYQMNVILTGPVTQEEVLTPICLEANGPIKNAWSRWYVGNVLPKNLGCGWARSV